MKTIIFILCLLYMQMVNAADGGIKGRIISYRNEPLTGVTVGLQNTPFTVTTDSYGYFTLKNIPIGTYTLVASSIGYTALKQNVVVEASKISRIDLQLSENQQVLKEVIVATAADSYKQSNSFLVTRTDDPLIAVPQSAQVITGQAIKDRQAFTLNDVTTVMTGVRAVNSMGAFSMRGFTGYYPFNANFITYNGIRGNLYLWSQQPLLYNVESVEVLRGPASVLFSEGMPGGIVNFVTKKPQAEKKYEVSATYGSWDLARFSADATGTLSKNKKWMYRAIAGYDRSNSFRDQQKLKNLFLAPSLTYRFSQNSFVNLEVNHSYSKAVHQYDRGTYVKIRPDGTYDFDYYPKNLTIQSPTDFGKTYNTSATLTFKHQVSNKLSVNAIERYVRNKFNFADHVVRGVIRNDSISRNYEIWDYDQFSWQTTAFINYTISTGKIKHSVLAGIDYNNYGWTKNDYRSAAASRIAILHPNYTNDIPAPSVNDYYDDNKQVINLTGGYLQDQLSIGQKLKLLLSLRYDSYRLLQTPLSAKDDLQGDTSNATAWMPRFGLVYLLKPNISFYASYNRSFAPQLSNSGSAGGPFPPKKAAQFEVGYKGDFFNNMLSTMVSLYSIDYKNILTAAPTATNPNKQAVLDGTRSKGVELTVQGTVGSLMLVAGYAYNDHVLTANSSLGKKGARFNNAPKHTANAWLKYNFRIKALNTLGVGIGGRYVSTQVGNLATQDFIIPSSNVFDAAVNYEVRRLNVQLNLYNLANVRYFNGGLNRIATASLGNPFNFRLGVNYTIR